MKKFITTLLILLATATTINAQSGEHLKFMGVPIDGTLTSFVQKLKAKGLTYVTTESGAALFKGDFAGHKNCTILVATMDAKNVVSRIGVLFSDCDTWSSLSSDYFSLKEMLTEKYGEPLECVEEFQGSSQPEDDEDRMYSVEFDRCKYYAIFITDEGTIELSISHQSVSSCFVRLLYIDRIGNEAVRAKAIDDL